MVGGGGDDTAGEVQLDIVGAAGAGRGAVVGEGVLTGAESTDVGEIAAVNCVWLTLKRSICIGKEKP